MLAAEATESTEPTEPTEPTESSEPAEPMDKIEPVEPMDKIEPLDPMLRIEPAEPPGSRPPEPLPPIRVLSHHRYPGGDATPLVRPQGLGLGRWPPQRTIRAIARSGTWSGPGSKTAALRGPRPQLTG